MYTQRVDRATPSCVIFLVDRSASMEEPLAGTDTPKATFVADQLNATVAELIQRCAKVPDEPPRPYFAVAVIGYGTDPQGHAEVGSALSVPDQEGDLVWTTDLALNPLRIEDRTRDTANGPISFKAPVWIEPRSVGGTPMCAAMDRAGRLASDWVQRYPTSFPPIILNLTDGESTDGDPSVWADRLRSLRTGDGEVLLFNLMLATGAGVEPTMFPAKGDELATPAARHLFEMSSELPEMMCAEAIKQGYEVEPGVRGMSMNADFKAVVTFVNVGTIVGSNLR